MLLRALLSFRLITVLDKQSHEHMERWKRNSFKVLLNKETDTTLSHSPIEVYVILMFNQTWYTEPRKQTFGHDWERLDVTFYGDLDLGLDKYRYCTLISCRAFCVGWGNMTKIADVLACINMSLNYICMCKNWKWTCANGEEGHKLYQLQNKLFKDIKLTPQFESFTRLFVVLQSHFSRTYL